MIGQRLGRQPDLFAPQPDLFDQGHGAEGAAPPPEDFIQRIRGELESTLAQVRAAEALPWPNLTRSALAEMRFHSVARWLPEREALALRRAFSIELCRLYETADAWPLPETLALAESS
ncbi:hypothetical protein [Siccirubricoccus sp. G192]|uniref:hypothetical protein n=1 Tax=Siccirubricoccus sp. G192 TaxID=2849651 RepID=UPI001C2C6693|nr:hypothetical protein [Siccirubricoccus sp. G192]MBV1797470.1 hypothetical protein [Siccirubricoccus sp. G192]